MGTTVRSRSSVVHCAAVLVGAAAFFSLAASIALAAAADMPVLPGELQVEGVIKSVDRIHDRIVISVFSVETADGKTTALAAPRPKVITLSDGTTIHVRGNSALRAPVSSLHRGVHAIAIGQDLGVGRTLPARDLSVWDSHAGGVYHLDALPAGSDSAAAKPAGSTESAIQIQPAALDKPLRAFPPAPGVVWSVAFSPDGRMLAAGGDTAATVKLANGGTRALPAAIAGGVRVWDTATGALIHTLSADHGVYAVAFSPDGRSLATANSDGIVRLWNLGTGAAEQSLGDPGHAVYTVAYSHEGGALASSSGDSTVDIWNPRTGALIRTDTGNSRNVGTVAYAPDGRVAASGNTDGTLTFWDPDTNEVKQTIQLGDVPASKIVFTPDGSSVASGAKDGTLTLWDIKTGKATWAGKTGAGKVQAIAISPDGKRLATGGDHKVEIWDIRDGTLISVINAHLGTVTSVAFSPDGHMIASSSMDRTVKLWKFD